MNEGMKIPGWILVVVVALVVLVTASAITGSLDFLVDRVLDVFG